MFHLHFLFLAGFRQKKPGMPKQELRHDKKIDGWMGGGYIYKIYIYFFLFQSLYKMTLKTSGRC